MSSALDGKTSQYAVAFATGAVKELAYKRLVMKSDDEPAVLKLKDRVSESLPVVEVVPKESPTGDHAANGAAESAVKELKGCFRAIKTAAEDRYGRQLDEKCLLLAWISRYAGNHLTRYRVYSDGRKKVGKTTLEIW